MEIFYSEDIDGFTVRLNEEESGHCVRVLRHRTGDEIFVIDGRGRLMRCRIVCDKPKGVETEIVSSLEGWGAHPYRLTAAVCPTKNIDRYEWFAEKATEIGVDRIVPVIGDHSERRELKTARLGKIVLSAAKQSLKGAIPSVVNPMSVKGFISSVADPVSVTEIIASAADQSGDGNLLDSARQSADGVLKLIACCFEDEAHPRRSIKDAIEEWRNAVSERGEVMKAEAYEENAIPNSSLPYGNVPEITVLIGPEGDFSREELNLAISCGFVPVHLGPSRLRTETAALLCVSAVYDHFAL